MLVYAQFRWIWQRRYECCGERKNYGYDSSFGTGKGGVVKVRACGLFGTARIRPHEACSTGEAVWRAVRGPDGGRPREWLRGREQGRWGLGGRATAGSPY